ncbi:TolC family protein [uncultured Desulfuromonas sp.]|uniref:TolC family protein n=1 Tax=uncultured Desulfuromonas sp. TaxID=181013 RepID=UPI002AAA82BF|nr:TolC family protein [uncultured Desulfuromonas sp.]
MRTCSTSLLIALALLACTMLSSCSPFAPQQREPQPKSLPTTYTLYPPTAPHQEIPWWQQLGGDELDQLMTTAFSGNFTLRQAWSRVEQARATSIITGSDLWPSLDYNGNASHQHQYKGDQRTRTESFALGLVGSYEIDLWGRIRSQTAAQRREQQATEEDWRTARITLSSEIAVNWLNSVALQQQYTIIERQIKTATNIVELTQLRYLEGQATRSDLVERQQELHQFEQSRLELEQNLSQYRYDLCLLSGLAPGADIQVNQQQLPALTPLPPVGVPADLLAYRPDVRAAGLRLNKGDWLVAAARADRLPAMRLSADAGYSSTRFADLFDNWLANLAASVTGPIFDAGSRRAKVTRARAEADELLAAYEETVITAVNEVESALLDERKISEQLAAVDQQIERRRQSLDNAYIRYLNGDDDYLSYLIVKLSVDTLQRERVQKQRDKLLARVALHRALGGTTTNSQYRLQ